MQIHDLNTKELTDPAYVAFDDGTDTYKTEFNDVVADAAAAAVADADLTDNTVAFTSGDAASPTAWTAVDVLTSGLPLKTLFNRISTMVKNVRYIWNKIGTTSMGTTATTITGAIAEHESDISALNSNTIKSVLIVERTYTFSSTKALNAHIGMSLTGLGGIALAPNVPSGYTFIGNVNVTLNGQAGVSATFDGMQATSRSVNPFIFNGSNNNISAGGSYTLRLYSLCYKN